MILRRWWGRAKTRSHRGVTAPFHNPTTTIVGSLWPTG